MKFERNFGIYVAPKLVFTVVASMTLSYSASAITFNEAANLHMLMETATHALSVSGSAIEDVNGGPVPFGPRMGQDVFSFSGSYSDTNWGFDGIGKLYGVDFSLSFQGTISGDYGSDISMNVVGTGLFDELPMDFSSNAIMKWNATDANYVEFDVEQIADTVGPFDDLSTDFAVDPDRFGRRWKKWFRRIVKAVEQYVTVTVVNQIGVQVTGALAPALGPGATIVGIAAQQAAKPIITKTTASGSRTIIRKYAPPDPVAVATIYGKPGTQITTLVQPDYGLAIVNNTQEGLIGTAKFNNGRIYGSFAAVPEPKSWTMMISGFGMVGFELRRRRRLSPV